MALGPLQTIATRILSALDCPEAELSILIVDDPQIAELNRQYLQREGPTNVIAFPMQEGEFPMLSPDLLGDVVVSVDTAEREASGAGMRLEDRFLELLIHGILHLLGYDHETDEAEAKVMEEKALALFRLIREEKGIPCPD